jgi:muramoyltetrapeptide carboxypeptidase
MIIPDKLKKGDEVRVISPSMSLSTHWISKEIRDIAEKRFSDLGFKLTFGKHVSEIDEFSSSSVLSRIEDFHDAFKDNNVKAVIAVTGGYNSIELLSQIDYSLIKKNPKIFLGFSDITALQNAIYSKTGLITYSGPHFFDFGDIKGFDYTLDYFKKCLMDESEYEIKPSKSWSDERWGKDQMNRTFFENNGFHIINPGVASGKIIGGNLCTLQLLQGTQYWPNLNGAILFIEDDDESNTNLFGRDLCSLSLNTNFNGVKGIVIGRFQKKSEISFEKLEKLIQKNPFLKNIPIITDVDFGHTTPRITFPIGGEAELKVDNDKMSLIVKKH